MKPLPGWLATSLTSARRNKLPGYAWPAASALLFSGAAAWLAGRNPLSLLAVSLWVFGLATLLWGSWPQAWNLQTLRGLPRLARPVLPEMLWVGLLTLLAFGLRAYDLTRYPAAFHGDEGEMGLMALAVLQGQPIPFFGTGWFGHPNGFFYLQAGSLALWGPTEAGLRMPGAWSGAAAVPLLYLAGRAGWGRTAGIVAAGLLAISHLHIHFSRLALNNVHSATAVTALLLLAILAFRLGAKTPALLYVCLGLVIGLSQYLYFGSLLLPIIAVPLLGWLWRAGRAAASSLLLVSIAALAAYAPLGWHYARHGEVIAARPGAVSIFTPEIVRHTLGPTASLPADLVPLLKHQTTRTLGFFTGSGDHSSFYTAELPAFDPLSLVLFWAGVLVALLQVKGFPERAVLLWLAAGVILGGVLTRDPPNAPRLIMVVPAVFLLAGIFAQSAWHRIRHVRWIPGLLPAALATGLAAVLLAVNIHTYFVQYDRLAAGLVPVSIGREMAAGDPPEAVFLAGAPQIFANHGTIQFLAGKTQPQDLENNTQATQAHRQGKHLLVIAIPARLPDLEDIQAQAPGGVRTDHYNRRGELLYAAYRVSPTGP